MNSMTATTVRKRRHGYARAWGACVAVLAAAATLLGAGTARAQLQNARTDAVPGELLVQFESGTTGAERADARQEAGAHVEEGLRRPGLQRLHVEPGTTVDEAIRRLQDNPDVRFAQPNLTYRAAAAGPDPDLPLWNLDRIGATSAWADTKGSPSVTVAVVDSGIADHADLTDNLDRSRGRDFVTAADDPVDDTHDLDGHGTHVAGIIAAEGNNGIGVAGVTWHSTLVPVRVLDGDGVGTSAELAEGLDYAGDIGVQVANVSISGAGIDRAVSDAIASHPGTLYVAAAGNEGNDNDAEPQQPCNVDAPNLICVAATTQSDSLASFSNIGATSVDLGAPGTAILSTSPPLQTLASWTFEGSNPLVGWNTSLSSWAVTTAHATTVGGHSMTESPFGDYGRNQNTSITTSSALNFSGRDGCAVDYRLDLDTGFDDWLRVRTSSDPAGPFTDQATWSGSTGGAFTSLRTYLYADGQSVYLRFNLLANGDAAVGDGAYVDDVVVSCNGGATGAEDYAELEGTSMASPHVTGTAALIWAARPAAGIASRPVRSPGHRPAARVAGRRDGDGAPARCGGGGARRRFGTARRADAGGADGVTSTGATVYGASYPCGTATSYQFEYGTTPSYGSATAGRLDRRVNRRSPSARHWAASLPSTTYHYRLVTIRDGARLAGPDRALTTAAAPPQRPPVNPGEAEAAHAQGRHGQLQAHRQGTQADRALHAAPGHRGPPAERPADEVRAPVREGERQAAALRPRHAQARAAAVERPLPADAHAARRQGRQAHQAPHGEGLAAAPAPPAAGGRDGIARGAGPRRHRPRRGAATPAARRPRRAAARRPRPASRRGGARDRPAYSRSRHLMAAEATSVSAATSSPLPTARARPSSLSARARTAGPDGPPTRSASSSSGVSRRGSPQTSVASSRAVRSAVAARRSAAFAAACAALAPSDASSARATASSRSAVCARASASAARASAMRATRRASKASWVAASA